MKLSIRIIPTGNLLFLGIIFGALIFASHPKIAHCETNENFMEEFLNEAPQEPINPLFRQSSVVQRQSISREGRVLLGLQPSLDVNFGPFANIGTGFNIGYAFSERFELNFLWIPYFVPMKKGIASQLADMEFSDTGDPPDIEQSKKQAEYTAVFHWAPGYGKISFSSNQTYRYDFFFDFILGWLQFQNTATAKIGAGFGNSLFFTDKFALRYSLWGTYISTPNLVTDMSSPTLAGELQLGFIFYL
jgi:hypothetical protein